MPFSGLTLTASGQTLYAKAQQGKTLHFTRVGIGDGDLGSGSRFFRPALLSEQMSLAIDAVRIYNETSASVIATLRNDDVDEGFNFREIGVFAEDPDTHAELLYLYDNAGEECEPIPPASSNQIVHERLKFLITLENAPSVTFEASGNPLYIAFDDIDDEQIAIDLLWSSSKISDELAGKLETGDIPDVEVTFTQAEARVNIATGETLAVLLGKIKKFFADLKAVAFSGAAADLTTDATHQLVTDTEKSTWNGKQDSLSGDVAGHYHSADRSRANHSGTQLAATISDFASTVRSVTLTGLSLAISTAITAADTILAALGKLQAQMTSHSGNTSNPHTVTKAQVGLGSADNTADSAKNVLSATKLTTARTISLSSDVTGSASFDGSGDISITATVANNSHTHAASNVTAGTLGGQVVANASAVATLGTAQTRNIYTGTSNMTAGSTALATGDIYLVYE